MKNPKIQKAFSDLMSGGGPMGLMSNPGKLQGEQQNVLAVFFLSLHIS